MVGKVIRILNQVEGLTVLLVTHNLAPAKLSDRTIELRDAKIRD